MVARRSGIGVIGDGGVAACLDELSLAIIGTSQGRPSTQTHCCVWGEGCSGEQGGSCCAALEMHM